MATQNTKFNLLFWVTGAFLVALSVAQYYFLDFSVLLRFILLLGLSVVGVFLFFKTHQGQKTFTLWQEALIELRKVVWPSRKETTQTAFVVLIAVSFAGVFLWSADAIFLRVVGWLMGHA